MSNGKYTNKRRKNNAGKLVVALLTMILIFSIGIGGTLAWLMDDTEEVVNTFSTSDIGVQLEETTTDYKMIPGWTIDKDPKAWIDEGSEAAYLFVKVEKSANFDTFMNCAIADGWTELTTAAGTNYKIYYREVATTQMGEDNAFPILKDNKVTVKETVTKEMMEGLTDATKPTLTFQAYAVQLYKSNTEKFTPADAWEKISG